MSKWVLYTQPNYVHPKPTHLTPLTSSYIIKWLYMVSMFKFVKKYIFVYYNYDTNIVA